jgi:hypothetical protein
MVYPLGTVAAATYDQDFEISAPDGCNRCAESSGMSTLLIPCPQCGRELKIRDRNLLGKRAKCPGCQLTFVLEEPAGLQLGDESAPIGTEARWVPDNPAGVVITPTASPAALPIVEPPSLRTLKQLQQRRSSGRWVQWVVGLAVIVVGGGIGYAVWTSSPRPDAESTVEDTTNPQREAEKQTAELKADIGLAARPTKGEPISLELIPAGARLLVHLRPAELWQPNTAGEEFRFCLGPLGEFVETQIKALSKFPPQAIEEVLFAWISGPRGTPPDFAYVVRLKDEAKKSDLLDALGGERVDTLGRPVYMSNNRATVIVDLKTFAVGPAGLAEEMVQSVGARNPMPTGVEELIKLSDRSRHITVLFEPTAVLLDEEFLAPENVRPFLRNAMDWFGEDVETAIWSLHLEQDRFYSDLQVRNQSGIGTGVLEERLRERLDQLPKDIYSAVKSMQPKEVGKRKVIGRMPAMTKVVSMATVTDRASRSVRLVTPLPDRAAPSLALGTLLAWDESTRTDFTKQPSGQPGGSDAGSSIPIAEKLKKKIDVDFRRTPLQEAFAYIGEETKVAIEIDGDALKLSGYTKNMPQSFKLDQVSGTTALAEVLKNYDKMCVVVDEPKKVMIVTTYPVAEQKKLKPFALTP